MNGCILSMNLPTSQVTICSTVSGKVQLTLFVTHVERLELDRINILPDQASPNGSVDLIPLISVLVRQIVNKRTGIRQLGVSFRRKQRRRGEKMLVPCLSGFIWSNQQGGGRWVKMKVILFRTLSHFELVPYVAVSCNAYSGYHVSRHSL